MMRLTPILALLLLAAPASASPGADRIAITVDVVGLQGDGLLLCKLFGDAQGWPESDTTPLERLVADIDDGRGQCRFEAPPGRYAVAVAHDANRNYRLDTNVVGIPKEGFGFSNGAKAGLFGPPDYADALFDARFETRQRIRIDYP